VITLAWVPASVAVVLLTVNNAWAAAVVGAFVAILGGIAHLLLRMGRLEGKVDMLVAYNRRSPPSSGATGP
jgi:hypothetical protein